MHRRAILMLVISGVAGVASTSAWAGAALRRKEGGRRMSAAAEEARGARGLKTGLPQFANLRELEPERQVVAPPSSGHLYRHDGRRSEYGLC
jgi:hypothetical protein